jgi:hypothetical protein
VWSQCAYLADVCVQTLSGTRKDGRGQVIVLPVHLQRGDHLSATRVVKEG